MRSRPRSGRAQYFYDWAGGLIWAALPASDDGGAARVRGALEARPRDAGPRAGRDPRRRAGVRAAGAGLAALTRRVKESFDPKGVLGPGRMYAGV